MYDDVDYVTWPQSTITVWDERDGTRIGFRQDIREQPERLDLRERMNALWKQTGRH